MFATNKVRPYIWLILFAGLMLFNGGRWTVPVVAWIAPVFGLLYILSVRHFWRGTLLLFVATYIALMIAWYGVVPFPMPIYPIFMVVNAIAAIFPFATTQLVMKRINIGIAQTLIFPIIATGVEYFMMGGSPLGSFGASAYTQYSFQWLTQIVSITGLWGIAFLISWFAATVAWSIQSDTNRPQKITVASIYGVVLLLAIGFGFYRLSNQPEDYASATMAGITAQSINMHELMTTYSDDVNAFRAETQRIHEAYIEATVDAIESDAQLILWSELAGVGIEEDVTALQTQLQQIATENRVYLAVPVFILFPDEPERPAENRLYIIEPNGEIVMNHVKYGGNAIEGTLAGDAELQMIDTPFGLIAAAICWDTDFPNVVRQAGQSGVDILLSPAYVWDAVANMHFDMAAFRAIENGMTVVRQSDHGFSGVITPYGTSLMRVNIGTGIVLMDVPINASFDTLFPKTGVLIGQGSFIGMLALIVVTMGASFIRRRKSPTGET